MDDKNNLPSWDAYYKENEIKKMPWYEEELDADLAEEIKNQRLSRGRFLDLGTGPGTQAAQLAKLGFEVVGTDISDNAINKAKETSKEAKFFVDDFLHSRLPDHSFDYVLDRGCYHIFDQFQRRDYMREIRRIMRDGSILFLKVMSKDEKDLPQDEGPYRFSKNDIINAFENGFEINSIKPTVYYGTLDPLPKALFAVMTKRATFL
ncbi:MAG: class I SAM-dependent methyltransferase [Crenarchaeota archaeon]|nr:MAG: class I SAM-dependent methyltransferase [Thermoproteota archaeon]RDJ33256.1 MAG: class I SAM-dependent methyltransferase [Thermoproteota archaeon]RDJ36241.1 MAG: class I SAM-dependent methyltransferase [Thermoproteota archaeon]RDJ38871.1 MAG: class I SAM-dependent methyltransferase [Thermoproteota archaeon]